MNDNKLKEICELYENFERFMNMVISELNLIIRDSEQITTGNLSHHTASIRGHAKHIKESIELNKSSYKELKDKLFDLIVEI